MRLITEEFACRVKGPLKLYPSEMPLQESVTEFHVSLDLCSLGEFHMPYYFFFYHEDLAILTIYNLFLNLSV